jgi:hypothetical protein
VISINGIRSSFFKDIFGKTPPNQHQKFPGCLKACPHCETSALKAATKLILGKIHNKRWLSQSETEASATFTLQALRVGWANPPPNFWSTCLSCLSCLSKYIGSTRGNPERYQSQLGSSVAWTHAPAYAGRMRAMIPSQVQQEVHGMLMIKHQVPAKKWSHSNAGKIPFVSLSRRLLSGLFA